MHSILTDWNTGLRPYLSAKYPPMILPINVDAKCDYEIIIFYAAVMSRLLCSIGMMMDKVAIYEPELAGNIRLNRELIKQ